MLIPNHNGPLLGNAVAHLADTVTVTSWTVAGLDDKEQQRGRDRVSEVRILSGALTLLQVSALLGR